MADSKWVRIGFVDIQDTRAGTFYAAPCRKRAPMHVHAFACRPNRRFGPRSLIGHLIGSATQTLPVHGMVIRESHVPARFQSDLSVNHQSRQR
jgi:hypothetical protein